MARTSLPPGFRFHPTDVELVMYYLKRKLIGKKLSFEAISELNIYKFSPWDLPDKSCLRSKDLEWFFFCPRERKYASGARTNRATEDGYWKTTGKDRPINYKEKTVGMVKTLVFHRGHAPRGERTDWVMHEYRIADTYLADAGVVQDAYVLCKFFQKSGPGPKNGAQYGAPFNEEEWEDDADICAESSAVKELSPAMIELTNNMNSTPMRSITVPGSTYGWPSTGPCPLAGPSASEMVPDVSDGGDIDSLLAMFTEETLPSPAGNDNSVDLPILDHDKVSEAVPAELNDIFNGLGHLANCADLNGTGDVVEAVNPMLRRCDTSFLELNDLETPLSFTAEATGNEQLPPDIFYAHYNCHGNMDQLLYGGDRLGSVGLPSALNQSPSLLEESYYQGNHFNPLHQENGNMYGTSQYNPTSYNGNLAFTRQSEGK